MFDFSMAELMVVMVVALVVIGPERLPKVARTLGHLYSRTQRYVNGVKAEITREMAMDDYHKLQSKIKAETDALQQSVEEVSHSVDEQLQQINRAVAVELPAPSIAEQAPPKS